ncbi:hypothetical protein [Spiroplasma tabanidicola]|uniref:Uncharacterized protein n=1 Tax=Spiroplasma tabanidicola TaxID=324079 RepID=A0A6I6C5T2_9MOLU|nr:hypothetical protein [Spiroplasma tabanidicola]QGS52247.1 hypothetical protein STABA_v1c08920 [Spiroplasma tabanidicola]
MKKILISLGAFALTGATAGPIAYNIINKAQGAPSEQLADAGDDHQDQQTAEENSVWIYNDFSYNVSLANNEDNKSASDIETYLKTNKSITINLNKDVLNDFFAEIYSYVSANNVGQKGQKFAKAVISNISGSNASDTNIINDYSKNAGRRTGDNVEYFDYPEAKSYLNPDKLSPMLQGKVEGIEQNPEKTVETLSHTLLIEHDLNNIAQDEYNFSIYGSFRVTNENGEKKEYKKIKLSSFPTYFPFKHVSDFLTTFRNTLFCHFLIVVDIDGYDIDNKSSIYGLSYYEYSNQSVGWIVTQLDPLYNGEYDESTGLYDINGLSRASINARKRLLYYTLSKKGYKNISKMGIEHKDLGVMTFHEAEQINGQYKPKLDPMQGSFFLDYNKVKYYYIKVTINKKASGTYFVLVKNIKLIKDANGKLEPGITYDPEANVSEDEYAK